MELDNKLLALLGELGLSRAEALTYNALLRVDDLSIRKIASHTDINRGTTYEALKGLVTLGLASVKRSGKREHYVAESPERIYELIRSKRQDLLAASNKAKIVVPNLLAEQPRPHGRPVVRYYEDDEGIATILRDVLQTCTYLKDRTYYAYSSSRIRQYIYRSFPEFTERRIAEGITVKVIAAGDTVSEPAAVSERKVLPQPENAEMSSYSFIYGDKVATISISSDFTPYGVVIEDSGVASMQRLLFEQLWGHLNHAPGFKS